MAFNSPPANFSPNYDTPLAPTASSASSGAFVVPGLCAAAGGVLGLISWFTDDGRQAGLEKASIIIAAAAAVLGGFLALSKKLIGVALGVGGAVFFTNFAISLVGQQLDFDDALDTTSAKLLLASGIVGLLAAFTGLPVLKGKANAGIATIVAILAFVPTAAVGALIHIDDSRETVQVAIVLGYAVVGLVMLIGALRGRFGVLTATAASLAHLPLWIDIVKQVDDRKVAAIAGAVAFGAIATLGLVALAASSAEETSPGSAQPGGSTPGWTGQPWMTTPVPGQSTFGQATFGHAPPGQAQFGQAQFGQPQSGQPQPQPDQFGQAQPTQAQSSRAPQTQIQFGQPAATAATSTSGQWAPDPYGRFQARYWNGTQWTEHVSSNGTNAIDPI